MRKLLCPQCKVSSMYVKNGKGERRAVYATDGGSLPAKRTRLSMVSILKQFIVWVALGAGPPNVW